ncbi:MAG TPA: PEGA domain-containing protein [Gemmataceae bacterium]|jgi:hypothetical protein|nr:PEGA domain-containing protein [Gemmataceae bacterium]
MKQGVRFLAMAVCAAAVTGCVERRYVIYTDPPGAMVLRNGQTLNATPVDDHFVYYGKYKFTIFADGYETLQVEQNIESPWYEYVGLDFVSENLIPWTIRDRRVFQYHLEPRRMPNPKELLDQAQNLRNRGITLGGGSAQPVAPPAPTAIAVPPVPPSVGPPPP